jgi:hypothetical protein
VSEALNDGTASKDNAGSKRLPWWVLAGAVAVLFIGVFGWLLQSCSAARDTSKRFVTAVRERRMDDAWALATPDVRTTSSRVVESLQAAREIDLSLQQSGFGDTPAHPFSCFRGTLADDKPFWIVARKLPEGWRVTELRSDAMPESCAGSE